MNDEMRRLEALMMAGVISGYRYTTVNGEITEIEAVNLPENKERNSYDYD